MSACQESNLGPVTYKVTALPLSYRRLVPAVGVKPGSAFSKTAALPSEQSPVAEGEGIEPPSLLRPTVFGTASSTNRTPSLLTEMAVGAGIEPTSPGPEPGVLPLNDPTVVPRAGIEPAPRYASGSRSTPELPRNGGKGGIRTHGPRAARLAARRLKPLSHLSFCCRRWNSNPQVPRRQAGAPTRRGYYAVWHQGQDSNLDRPD